MFVGTICTFFEANHTTGFHGFLVLDRVKLSGVGDGLVLLMLPHL
jgi:hypothetical protein